MASAGSVDSQSVKGADTAGGTGRDIVPERRLTAPGGPRRPTLAPLLARTIRLARDYEPFPEHAEACSQVAMIGLMICRLVQV